MKILKTILLSTTILAATTVCAMEETATTFTDYEEVKQKLTATQEAQAQYAEFLKSEITDDYKEQYAQKCLDNMKEREKEISTWLEIAAIAENPQHPAVLEAILDILNHRNDAASGRIQLITDEATIAAIDPHHENWISASLQLLYSTTKEYRNLAHKNLTKFAQDALKQIPESHPQYETAQKMAAAESL